MTEHQAALAAAADAEQQRPGRAAHLQKIAAAVAPVEHAADAEGRSADPSTNGIIRHAGAPHHDVGRGS